MLKSSNIEKIHIEDLERICLDIKNSSDGVINNINTALVSLKLFAHVMEILSHPVMITGPDRKIVYVNKIVEDLTGFSSEEIVGRVPDFFYCLEDKEYFEKDKDKVFLEEIKRKIKEKKFFARNYSFFKKDVTKFKGLISYFPVMDKDENLLFYVTTAHELTDSGQVDVSDVG